MTRPDLVRWLIRGVCLSAGLMGVTGDVLLNPHLYGEYVRIRSTVISGTVLVIWPAIGITYWIERRTLVIFRQDASGSSTIEQSSGESAVSERPRG